MKTSKGRYDTLTIVISKYHKMQLMKLAKRLLLSPSFLARSMISKGLSLQDCEFLAYRKPKEGELILTEVGDSPIVASGSYTTCKWIVLHEHKFTKTKDFMSLRRIRLKKSKRSECCCPKCGIQLEPHSGKKKWTCEFCGFKRSMSWEKKKKESK